MKVTVLSLTPPNGAEKNPRVTPELLASVLAKYSRSNEGLDNIMAKVDLANPEESINRILKFVDYGHASIGGLTGGIPVAIDGVTMWMAYKLFELSPMCDGQESSTRYISMSAEGLPVWTDLGFLPGEAAALDSWAQLGLRLYDLGYQKLNEAAELHPEIVRIPAKLADKPLAVARLRKNYALDRARYFLPFALKTNIALVQTGRMWAETLSGLYSTGIPEATMVADLIKKELEPYVGRLLRHARAKPGWVRAYSESAAVGNTSPGCTENKRATSSVLVTSTHSDEAIARALAGRENRYDRCGQAACDTTIRMHLSNIAIAELRDLNRHRTGNRYSPINHHGFYLPDETREVFQQFTDHDLLADWEYATALALAAAKRDPRLRPYTLSLGSQTEFVHTTQLDKFVYTAELRTSAGAHFRYANHYMEAVADLASTHPLTAAAIQTGDAEPE